MGLLPKDETFWEFFTKETASLSLASDLLFGGAKDGAFQLAGAAVRIKALERESALLLRDLQQRLHDSFVTPIDPEDLSQLFERLDHQMDGLEAIAYRLMAYRIEPLPPLIQDLAKLIHSNAELIERAVGMLSIKEPTSELCQQITGNSEQTDLAIREGVTRLFNEENDFLIVLKAKEIYDMFERLNLSQQDLANLLQNVSIKNS